MQTTTLRPGYLVHLGTSVMGNTTYTRRDIVSETYTGDGKKFAQWETGKTINDPEEQEEAESIRSRATALVRGLCINSGTFGLSCPKSRKADLDAAAADARGLVAAFNAKARITRIRFNVTTGEIADSDLDAIRQINTEVRDLLETMAEGCRNLEVTKIRDAAAKAKQLGAMLSDDAAKRIATAVDAVRAAARRIVQAGETAAVEVDSLALKRIAEARTAFLDLDEAAPMQAPTAEGRALDLTPEAQEPEQEPEATPEPTPAPPAIRVPQFALEF